ncbi:hypothetical protein DFH07DRAFT_781127 [Mycena maculata]|uniref:No apical meristem-associated C-terminal domain-containing protein n=1 Tax=Mycena maculata TaxID=230809 RepID=A0AAD7MTT7_9AGAR|nr:hypothetical protein DFH07DRAFT_781127 [Mycena maculata]
MGQTGAGLGDEDEILAGTKLATRWDVIKAEFPWFYHVRTLIASRPNLQPVGLGNNNTDFDVSLLIPTRDDDTSSAPDDTTSAPDDAPDDTPDPPEHPSEPGLSPTVDIVTSDSDNDLLDTPTLANATVPVKRKRGVSDSTEAPPPKPQQTRPKKKTKPQPAVSIPAPPAAAPAKKTTSKDRFSATILAEEETAQRQMDLRKEKNDARKEVALKKISMEGEIRLAKAEAKREEKAKKLELARLRMEQEHQFRMAQLQNRAPEPSTSSTFSGIFDDLPRLPSADSAGPSTYFDNY